MLRLLCFRGGRWEEVLWEIEQMPRVSALIRVICEVACRIPLSFPGLLRYGSATIFSESLGAFRFEGKVFKFGEEEGLIWRPVPVHGPKWHNQEAKMGDYYHLIHLQ